MRVLDNLLFFAAIHGVPAAVARRRAGEWLERMRMTRTASMRLQELSKGNQQKIQLIATLLHEPELLVLDEPFSGLDPVNQEELRGIVRELAARGTTLVLSTHLMDEVERLCTHLTLLNEGRAVLDGSLDDVRRRFGGNVCRVDFRGDPGFVASIPGVVDVARTGNTLEVRLDSVCDPPALLAQIAPRLAVHRFEVRSASLHSIFVRLVGPTPEPAREAAEVAS
jgi:ABC-2 type transport system ATP-binding protein